ncbi:MAG: hypothetical protein ACLVAV_15210 [Clostridium sp.]
MYAAILALVNPGDEILIADPSYTNYVGEIVMNRAVAVLYLCMKRIILQNFALWKNLGK